MPRKSKAALATVPGAPVPREPPPAYLPDDEKAEWRKVIDGLPRDWIPPGAYCLVEIYVTSVINMRACRAIMLAEVEGSPRHAAATKLYRQEAAQVVKLSKLLRLGPRHDRTKLRAISSLPKPWDLGDGDGGAPLVSEFRGWPKCGGDEPPSDPEPAA